MAKHLTPIVGLAVVVALALAAVFGSMSLANPAMAAIGQSGDAELTERVDSPQAAEQVLYIGQTEATMFDISTLITGGGSNYKSLANVTVQPDTLVSPAPTITPGFGAINLSLTPGTTVQDGRVVLNIVLQDDSRQRITIPVDVKAATSPMVKGEIDDQTVGKRPADDTTTADVDESNVGFVMLDVSKYFENGKGTPDTSQIVQYTVNTATIAAVTVSLDTADVTARDYTGADITSTVGDGATDTNGKIILRAGLGDDADVGASSFITVNAQVPAGTTVATQTFFVDVVPLRTPIEVSHAGLPTFDASSQDPGDSANYTVAFAMEGAVNTRLADLVIEFHEDQGMPSTIRNTSVAVTTSGGTRSMTSGATPTSYDGEVTFTPEDVTVDGEKVLISLGDMDERDDVSDYELTTGEVVRVHFRQSASITTPTEHGEYFLVAIDFGDDTSYEFDEGDPPNNPGLTEDVYRKIGLSEDDGGLGDTLTATGKGYRNGTTLTVFLDKPTNVLWDDDDDDTTPRVLLTYDSQADATAAGRSPYQNNWAAFLAAADANDGEVDMNAQVVSTTTDAQGAKRPVFLAPHPDATVTSPRPMVVQGPDGLLRLGEDVLCVAPRIDGNDVGTCEFTVTHPTFTGGVNYVNAVDGRNQYADTPKTFVLEASIAATPAGGSPGETIVIQVVDFPTGPISSVEISRRALSCGSCGGSVDATGAGNFSIAIPNWAKAGIQELRVTGVGGVKASTNITLAGPRIQATPESVVANRRISLVGTGFSPGAVVANAVDELPGSVAPKMSVGGETVLGHRINDGDPVTIDNGGNWSASVDLPLAEATTAEGERAIRVTDSRGRTGVVMVNVQPRSVTVTPSSGRVGTIAVVRGTGFPGKNDEGSSFNIEIVYDANNDNTTTVSAQTDASGRFEAQLRIPTTAAIPSSNTIKVSFEDDDDVVVTTTVAHEVPEGVISLSDTGGGPGSTITISGEGFKSHVPVSLVRIGALDITPAPKPNTDVNGMMEFDVLIPGLDVGIQTIEVSVGQTTASTGFTVTESGINPGDIKLVAEAVEPLGENLEVVWHFNNDTKAWTFYDGMEGSDLTHMITGETYLIQVKSSVEVILNRDTRSLTCVGGNCWNQIVW